MSWKKLDPPLKKYHVGFTIIPFIQNLKDAYFSEFDVLGENLKNWTSKFNFLQLYYPTIQWFFPKRKKSLSFSNSANSFWWEKMLKSQQKIICISLFSNPELNWTDWTLIGYRLKNIIIFFSIFFLQFFYLFFSTGKAGPFS